MLKQVERRVWAVWNLLSDDDPTPVKRIAWITGLTTDEVAFIVFPAEHFGRWEDSQEPDLIEGSGGCAG